MRSLMDLLRDFGRAKTDMEKLIKNTPRIIGVEAVRVVHENFRLQGYDGAAGLQKWVPRAPATNKAYDRGKTKSIKTGLMSKWRIGRNSTYKGSVFSSQKPLLEQTMNLYNAIDYKVSGKTVTIGVNNTLIPYAKIHNEGGRGIPKRQYMPLPNQPATPKMVMIIKKRLDFETDKAMQTFKK